MEVLWQGVKRGEVCQFVVEEQDGIPVFSYQPVVEEGLLTRIARGTENFVKAHPFISAFAAYKVYSAVNNYLKNKNDPTLTKMYAAKPGDRPKYYDMIREMKKQGWYVHSEKYVGGSGYEWTLKRNY